MLWKSETVDYCFILYVGLTEGANGLNIVYCSQYDSFIGGYEYYMWDLNYDAMTGESLVE